jgi:hypothetical protein
MQKLITDERQNIHKAEPITSSQISSVPQ